MPALSKPAREENFQQDQPIKPLRVVVVGAGIGGLTAAIALRRQGHNVDIFEQSRLAQETGAAIHLGPNCNGLLRRLGIFAETFGAVDFQCAEEHVPETSALSWSLDESVAGKDLWAHPWHMVHRAHLHSALKDMATDTMGSGGTCTLRTASRVRAVDSATGTVSFEDGTEITGDVIIGADGVHSVTRKSIPGGDLTPFDSGKSAFRFLIPTEVLRSDPNTAFVVDKPGCLKMWTAEDRRLVMYPCVNNTLMNFAAIHPSHESAHDVVGDGWHEQGNKSLLLHLFSSFHSSVMSVLEKVDESKLKVWKLLDMEKMPTFAAGRLAVLGDAAHPFTPYQGQGGAQAIEDAVSIAAMLPMGVSPDEVPARLQLYASCRYERPHLIQQVSRDLSKGPTEQRASIGKRVDMRDFTMYNVGWDEWDASRQVLKKYLEAKDPSTRYRAPVAFGSSPSPRRPLSLSATSTMVQQLRQVTPESFTTYSVKFKSSRTFLQNLLPPGFAFTSPGTLVSASLICTTLDGMTWLAGGGYSHIGLYLHGVHYVKRDGSKVFGTHLPVLFENLADPIVTGRAELGMPKLFADINIDHDGFGKAATIQLSWRGAAFGTITFQNLATETAAAPVSEPVTSSAPLSPPEEGILLHRYVPAVGEPRKTDADYAVLCPYPPPVEPMDKLVTKDASIRFEVRDWQRLPTLHHITEVLAEMPIYEIEEASWRRGLGVDDFGSAHRVE